MRREIVVFEGDRAEEDQVDNSHRNGAGTPAAMTPQNH
jgi:hypothetical protein